MHLGSNPVTDVDDAEHQGMRTNAHEGQVKGVKGGSGGTEMGLVLVLVLMPGGAPDQVGLGVVIGGTTACVAAMCC